ncbi:hypothetical protein BC827DRAFT_1247774, partial [Russula dissimulans]
LCSPRHRHQQQLEQVAAVLPMRSRRLRSPGRSLSQRWLPSRVGGRPCGAYYSGEHQWNQRRSKTSACIEPFLAFGQDFSLLSRPFLSSNLRARFRVIRLPVWQFLSMRAEVRPSMSRNLGASIVGIGKTSFWGMALDLSEGARPHSSRT